MNLTLDATIVDKISTNPVKFIERPSFCLCHERKELLFRLLVAFVFKIHVRL